MMHSVRSRITLQYCSVRSSTLAGLFTCTLKARTSRVPLAGLGAERGRYIPGSAHVTIVHAVPSSFMEPARPQCPPLISLPLSTQAESKCRSGNLVTGGRSLQMKERVQPQMRR